MRALVCIAVLTLAGCGGGNRLLPDGGVAELPAATIDPMSSTVALSQPEVVADGVHAVTITVTLKTSAGDPGEGYPVSFHVTGTANTLPSAVVSDSNGTAQASWTSTHAEVKSLDVVFRDRNGTQPLGEPREVPFTPGPLSASESKLLVNPAAIPADGQAEAVLRLAPRDRFDNPIPCAGADFQSDFSGAMLLSDGGTTPEGDCLAWVSATREGTASVTATLAGGEISAPVTFRPEHSIGVLRFGGATPSSQLFPARFQTGIAPPSFATGDWNGDGILDTVSSNWNELGIHLGKGDGTFTNTEASLGTSTPGEVVLGDVNGDGRTDAVIFNDQGLTVALQQTDGSVTPVVQAVGNVIALAQGDFNADGRVDVAFVVGDSATVVVGLAKADGTFSDQTLTGLDQPTRVAAGDFNGDGNLDLAVFDFTGSTSVVSVFLGDGAGGFGTGITSSRPFGSPSVRTADFDGDGNLDLLVVDSDYAVMLGNGDGTFLTPITGTSPVDPTDSATGDFNRDGKTDVVLEGHDFVGNYETPEAELLLGNGDGSFTPAAQALPTADTHLGAGDTNGDGQDDLLEGDGTMVLFGGDGLHAWDRYAISKPASDLEVDTIQCMPALGDIDGDGDIDLVVGAQDDESLSVLTGRGDGTFDPPVRLPLAAEPTGVALRDVNGDGALDLVILEGSTVAFRLGNGDGSFQAPVTQAFPGTSVWLSFADLDADGELDLGLSTTHGVIPWLGEGGLRFTAEPTVGLGDQWGSHRVVLVDGDQDGKVDLATMGQDNAQIFEGNGDGTFQAPLTFAIPEMQDGAWADFGGGALPGLVVTGYDGTDSVTREPDGGWLMPRQLSSVAAGNVVTPADFNQDGRLDIAVGDWSGVSVFLSGPDGEFQAPLFYTADMVGGMASADLDGDGRPDLVTVDQEGMVDVLLNRSLAP